MIEETDSKPKEVIAKPKTKKVGKKVFIGVDKTVQNVLDCIEAGDDIFFAEKDDFLELPTSVYKELPIHMKERYMLAKEITLNGISSVMATATDGLNGWGRDYDVQPGTPTEKLQVFGKDDKYGYRWARPDKIGKRSSEGFEVDRDPNVKTYGQPESEVGKAVPKAVGGRKSSELILMRRRKDVADVFKKKKAEKLASYTTRAKDGFKEDVIKGGGIPTEE
jgi:hypothetical protein